MFWYCEELEKCLESIVTGLTVECMGWFELCKQISLGSFAVDVLLKGTKLELADILFGTLKVIQTQNFLFYKINFRKDALRYLSRFSQIIMYNNLA